MPLSELQTLISKDGDLGTGPISKPSQRRLEMLKRESEAQVGSSRLESAPRIPGRVIARISARANAQPDDVIDYEVCLFVFSMATSAWKQ